MGDTDVAILYKILDWVWIILSFGLVALIRKQVKQDVRLNDHDTCIALINQHDENEVKRREEDRRLRDRQRIEITKKIDRHHELIMNRLDDIIDRNK